MPEKNMRKNTDCTQDTRCGLYIHIPFCKRRCKYCSFFSTTGEEEKIPRYIKALGREMQRYAKTPVESVYIGGGTPSILKEKQIEELMLYIQKYFVCAEKAEITFEANPESVTMSKLRMLKSLGVNRLSIGVQSFRDDELLFLGRGHTAEDALMAYGMARDAGFDNCSMDLIYGWQSHEFAGWRHTVKTALEVLPEHISIYDMTVEPGCAFYKDHIVPACQDLQADLWKRALEQLEKKGYDRYEISNFSLNGHSCIHNINYWTQGAYIGIGAGAVSFDGKARCTNIRHIDGYIDGILNPDRSCPQERERLSPEIRQKERIILGLRMSQGVTIEGREKTGLSSVIDELLEEGLIRTTYKTISLTRRGYMLANYVFRAFL